MAAYGADLAQGAGGIGGYVGGRLAEAGWSRLGVGRPADGQILSNLIVVRLHGPKRKLRISMTQAFQKIQRTLVPCGADELRRFWIRLDLSGLAERFRTHPESSLHATPQQIHL